MWCSHVNRRDVAIKDVIAEYDGETCMTLKAGRDPYNLKKCISIH